jgi:glycosyltransferase involved in cell wall biosynthesis
MNEMERKPPAESAKSADLLSVVVPVYNEAAALPAVLEELVPYCRARGWQLILVDDGSTDGTAALLEDCVFLPGVTVLRHKINRGYGGALKTGLLQARTDFAVTIDADGQHTLSDIDELLDFALERDADLVVGKRTDHSHSGMYRNIGKWLIRRFAGLLMPIHISDLNSGFKLYRTPLVRRYLSICPDSMAFSDVISLIFIKKRHLVLEHGITIRRRSGGKSTITTFTALQTVMEIINIAMLFNPLRIFLPLAAFCITFGFAWGLPIMLRARGVSVGAMLAIVTGLFCFFFGLIAEQLSALRMGQLDDDRGRDEP